jgi:putative tricarboxylic transport membrane protein
MAGNNGAPKGGGGAARRARRLVNPTDLRLCVAIVSACAGLYYVTTGFEQVSDLFAQDVPPEFFPRLLLWTIVLLALLLPFEHLHLRRRNRDIDADRTERIRPAVYATAALLCVAVAAMPLLGIWVVLSLVCCALPLLWGERRLVIVVPFAAVFPGAVALLFSRVLNVYLEPGTLWSALAG